MQYSFNARTLLSYEMFEFSNILSNDVVTNKVPDLNLLNKIEEVRRLSIQMILDF